MKKNYFCGVAVVLFAVGSAGSAIAGDRSVGPHISGVTIRTESPVTTTDKVSEDSREAVGREVSGPTQDTTSINSTASLLNSMAAPTSSQVELNDATLTPANVTISIGDEEPDSRNAPAPRVSKWLEARAIEEDSVAAFNSYQGSLAMPQVTPDLEVDMGGGWCDDCGCWMHHGKDPNGTSQADIGHPYVCTGGVSSQACWIHYYDYCYSSS